MTPREVVEGLRQDYAQGDHPDDDLPPMTEDYDPLEDCALDIEYPHLDMPNRYTTGIEEGWITGSESDLAEDEEDFLIGKTCNPDAPEECESCQ